MTRFGFTCGGCGENGQCFRVNKMGKSWEEMKKNAILEDSQSMLMAICRIGQHKSNHFTEPVCLRISEVKKVLMNYL